MIDGEKMKFKELTEKRYSQRGYLDKIIEQDKLDYILECSRLAPSAANRQPWKIYIVKDAAIREKLVKSYDREWFAEAPLIVVFTGNRDKNWKRKDGADYLLCDVTIIADYFILAAEEVGLGSCYIAAFDKEIAEQAIDLGENEEILLMTPLGYPKDGVTRERKREDIKDIVRYI